VWIDRIPLGPLIGRSAARKGGSAAKQGFRELYAVLGSSCRFAVTRHLIEEYNIVLIRNNMLRMVGAFPGYTFGSDGPIAVDRPQRSQRLRRQVNRFWAKGQEPTGPGGTTKAAPLTGGQQSYSARFDNDLFIQDPIQLRGVRCRNDDKFCSPSRLDDPVRNRSSNPVIAFRSADPRIVISETSSSTAQP